MANKITVLQEILLPVQISFREQIHLATQPRLWEVNDAALKTFRIIFNYKYYI